MSCPSERQNLAGVVAPGVQAQTGGMKTLRGLRPLRRIRFLRPRRTASPGAWQHWGELISPRTLVVTEDEARHHRRLEAESPTERLTR